MRANWPHFSRRRALGNSAIESFLKSLSNPQEPRGVLDHLPADLADLVRRCAIPHHFELEMLEVLAADLPADRLSSSFDALMGLPFIDADDSGLFLHDAVRSSLFSSWLVDGEQETFKGISARLASFFASSEPAANGSFETSPDVIFHTMAVDQTRAMELLRDYFEAARSNQQIGNCQMLLNWCLEYGERLEPATKSQLHLYAGIVAGELRYWTMALEEFALALDSDVSRNLFIKVALGRAQASVELRQYADAIRSCSEAYTAAGDEFPQLQPEILLTWGRVLREAGELDEAEAKLHESAQMAMSQGKSTIAAGAFNALGALYRKRNDPRKAIRSFEQALERLDRENRLSIARTKSNIGALFSDLNDWSDAELALREALALYREIRDRHGEATTLNNLLRVSLHKGLMEEAEQNAERAARLFVEARDYYSAAVTKKNLAQIVHRNPKRQDWKEFLSEAMRLFERASALDEVRQVRRELKAGYGRLSPPSG